MPRQSTNQGRDDRVTRVEAVLAEVQRTLEVQFQRIAAMQAQLGHLSARKTP